MHICSGPVYFGKCHPTWSENEAKEETLKASVTSSLLCFHVSRFCQEWVVFVTYEHAFCHP